MSTYFSTFTTGTSEIIESEVKQFITNIEIKRLEDGFIVYSTAVEPRSLKGIKSLHNTFTLFKTFKKVSGNLQSINTIFREIIKDKTIFRHLKTDIARKASFRVIVSVDNQMVSCDKNLLKLLENSIIINNGNLRVDKLLPDVEFWILVRRGGKAYFGLRHDS